jgi:hypothetical protein
MSDETTSARWAGRGVLIWAVTATLAAVLLANVALVLWVRLRQAQAASTDHVAITRTESAPRRSSSAEAAPVGGAFDQLQESDVAGRYRFFDGGVELSKIMLLPNHSIINKDGTTYPKYRWEIQSDGILTVWQRGQVLLNVMEKPGVYVAIKKDGAESLRIEKLDE